jgi:DNA-3-methyladenine glycosylase
VTTAYGRRLSRSFYARPAHEVAPDLLGSVLVRRLPAGGRIAGRVVEVEAYGPEDPASHAFRGPTARNAVMFGPPGRLYVYLSYGLHACSNVVTGRAREGSAVLLRALEPLEGLETMIANRGLDAVRLLCSGPGRLAQAMGITRSEDGVDLVTGVALSLHEGTPVPRRRVERTSRIGLSVGREVRWRYLERGNPFVSRGRPSAHRPLGSSVRG